MINARLAIFVGGKSTRMGTPKGLLPLPGGGPPILKHLADLGINAGLDPFLVGEAEAYSRVVPHLPRIEDDPAGVGPLGGLRAALLFAGTGRVISVGCDMPYLDRAALRALLEAPATAPVVAARQRPDAPWEPMFARYDVATVMPVLDHALAAGDRSFQRLFARLDVVSLTIDASVTQALVDWDTPDDVVP